MQSNKKSKLVRILAFLVVIILICLIIATLIVALFGGAKELLFALIFADIVIPISIYALLLITKMMHK